MKELEALNKMIGIVFAYGPSRRNKKARKVKRSARVKKINAKRHSDACRKIP